MAVVEAVRHLIIRTNRLVLGAESDTVPLHRWLLSPWKTWSLCRRMKLWQVTSYARMVEMERDRTVYRAWFQHKHGRAWRKKRAPRTCSVHHGPVRSERGRGSGAVPSAAGSRGRPSGRRGRPACRRQGCRRTPAPWTRRRGRPTPGSGRWPSTRR
ncbi:DUF2637 domain-containing protein [Streptomyces sp. NPDC056069]|uniref:DUF2637 domain-containing protein n=1 Tax=Streptomyces sp. NPDC056069 TaxID=3345702 RepID=UPI0035E08F0A